MKHSIHMLVLGALLTGPAIIATATPAHAAQTANANDADITAKVKAQLGSDEFKGTEIDVTTANGVVTLKGVAASAVARAKVGEMTKATAGVTKVVNKVTLAKK